MLKNVNRLAVIGGRAHINGITFATGTSLVRGKLKDGEITFRVLRLPEYRIIERMDKVPFLRGISKLAKLNLKFFLFILVLLALPWDWIFPSSGSEATLPLWFVLGIYGLMLLILKLILKRLWQFHGAEHKAFNVYTSGRELSEELVQQANRVSERCGTNLVVILLPLMLLLSLLIQIPLFTYLLSLSLGYEIFDWAAKRQRLRPVFVIAGYIQQYFVTAEPSAEQIRLAIATLTEAMQSGNLDKKL